MDEVQVLACNVYSNLTLDERPTLFLEFHGSNKRDVEEQARSVGNICSSNGGSSFVWSTLPHEIDKLWTARHNAYYAALSLRKGARGFTTDVCVPISRLTQVIVETRMDLTHSGLIGKKNNRLEESIFLQPIAITI
uniref:FAD-oxidase_C domain-containing protein n=1 Tax=Heterorhabditis bacteriophora TaxID=37862 RepID=A0A1I7WDZ3_HETBA